MVTSCWLNGPSETVSTRAVLLELFTGRRQGLLEKGRSLHLAAKRLYCYSVTLGSSDLQLDWKTTKTLTPLVFLRVAVCDFAFRSSEFRNIKAVQKLSTSRYLPIQNSLLFPMGIIYPLHVMHSAPSQNHCGDCCGDGCGTFFFLAVSFRPDSSHNLI